MGIFKKANNIYITVRGTYTSIGGTSYEEAEEVIIEATNGDLELVSQKKVIMQGLGNNSDTQETEGQREEEKVINAPCVVHFRPKKGWKGEDYGFDWMRLGEDGESPYQDIVGKMFKKDGSEPTASDINNTDLQLRIGKDGSRTPEDIEMFENLEKIYGVYEVPFEYRIGKEKATHTKYYPSWLSVYPNKEIQLQLKIFIKEKSPNALLCFQENENFEITPNQIDISNKRGPLKDINITIKCVNPLGQDQEQILYIRQVSKGEENKVDKTKPLAGVLRVWRNAPKFQKQVKVLFVKVNIEKVPPIKGKSTYKENSPISHLFGFLEQTLTKVDIKEFELHLKEIPETNIEKKGWYQGTRIIGAYLNGEPPTGFRSIADICFEKLKGLSEYSEEYNSYPKIFFFHDRLGGWVANEILQSKEGYTEGNIVILFSNIKGSTPSHELLHVLGLEHSFNKKEQYEAVENAEKVNIFTFLPAKTDNIMDYPKSDKEEDKGKLFALGKWQWELLSNLLTQN